MCIHQCNALKMIDLMCPWASVHEEDGIIKQAYKYVIHKPWPMNPFRSTPIGPLMDPAALVFWYALLMYQTPGPGGICSYLLFVVITISLDIAMLSSKLSFKFSNGIHFISTQPEIHQCLRLPPRNHAKNAARYRFPPEHLKPDLQVQGHGRRVFIAHMQVHLCALAACTCAFQTCTGMQARCNSFICMQRAETVWKVTCSLPSSGQSSIDVTFGP